MKRLFACLAGIAVGVSLLSGCGSSAKVDSGNSSGKEVRLTFMGWEASPLETESVKNGITKFESQNPNIKVNYTPTPGEYTAKLLTMMAGDAAPDVFFLGDADYVSFIKRDVLLDLSDQFYQGLKDEDFIDSSINIMKRDGKIFGVSSCTVSPVLFYNKDIFDAAGEPYPPSSPEEAWTFDEFREVAKRLTKKQGNKVDIYGVYGLESSDHFVFPSYASMGKSIVGEDQKTFTANTPEFVKLLEDIRNVRKIDGSAPSAATLENIGMSDAQMLQTGKIAMLVTGSWALQELANMNFPVGIAPLPKYGDTAVTFGGAHVHAAWAKTKHPEEAWKFIQFLSSEEYQTDLIRSGLWMPNRKSLYTEEGSQKWYTEDVYGNSFLDMKDYFKNALSQAVAMISNTEFNTIRTEIMDEVFKNEKDIQETVNTFEKRANEVLSQK